MINNPMIIGTLELKNRLVMPPMHTGKGDRGHVTDDLIQYYADRAKFSKPCLIICEHCCITEQGRASETQLSIADDSCIAEHRRLTDAIHEAGSKVFIQLNHAGSMAEPLDGGEIVSASATASPRRPQAKTPRALTTEEIHGLEKAWADAAIRALKADYDGVEIHSAHGYLLNQFYSPLTNGREDEYSSKTMGNRLRFLLETVQTVKEAIGIDIPLAVRLGGSDYCEGGSTEEDAVEACRMLTDAGVHILDISGGMCGYIRPDVTGPGYFSTMTEKINAAVKTPIILTGGVKTMREADALLEARKADLIGVGRALFQDAHWREKG